jgi:hypothetical protein
MPISYLVSYHFVSFQDKPCTRTAQPNRGGRKSQRVSSQARSRVWKRNQQSGRYQGLHKAAETLDYRARELARGAQRQQRALTGKADGNDMTEGDWLSWLQQTDQGRETYRRYETLRSSGCRVL